MLRLPDWEATQSPYEWLISPETYGVDPNDIAVIRHAAVLKIPHTLKLPNGNIIIASHSPLLSMHNSNIPEVGRIYLALKDPSVLEVIDSTLREHNVYYFLKVSTDFPRIDQVCIYFHGDNNPIQSVIDAIREIYDSEKDNIVPVRMLLAATLNAMDGTPMTGINFKQSNEAMSPNNALADAIREKGLNATERDLAEFLERCGYDPENPAFQQGSDLFTPISEVSVANGLAS